MWNEINQKLSTADIRSLARAISLVENEANGFETFMKELPSVNKNNIIGITGPPGAGKSTLTDSLIEIFINEGKTVAVVCVDPSSPFHSGAILGDRIRMNKWHQNPNVYIRSLASRGHLGGLNPKVIEITDILKTAGFDYIIVETIGVGQNEVDIAGLADATIVVLVPEAGDEIQVMKSGLMEVADIFVLNKSDRPGADRFVYELHKMLDQAQSRGNVPVLKTIANEKVGVMELKDAILQQINNTTSDKKNWLRAEKAFQLIVKRRTADLDKTVLLEAIKSVGDSFNLYLFIEQY